MTAPLLTTKLEIPPVRPNLVSRTRLIERLDQGLGRKLSVVSAPAGFGKTTLLGEWVHTLQERRDPGIEVGWISLDESDNDPARFAAYLWAALRTKERQGDAFEPGGAPLQQTALVQLINQIARLPETVVLVLDDYHLITSAEIHDALAFAIDHLPGNLHLALATRADPPLPLPRLRARGQLTELRQSDLCFTTEEAATFLNRTMGLDLSAEDVAALEARTEGWIAGLQMASLAMQRQPAAGEAQDSTDASRAEFVRAFTGSHRFILDYLTEEVLQRQPEEVKNFLLCTSILERMCAPLCDALLEGWKNGGLAFPLFQPSNLPTLQSSDLLAHLDRANLFLVPLDQERRWYRYHRLFADLLRRRLLQSAPEIVPDLHRRASTWYEREGLAAEAIEHALAADDVERAAGLVEAAAEQTFMRSEVITVLNWIERLPDKEVRARPTLTFFYAWALLMSGRSAGDVERGLQELSGIEDPRQPPGTMRGRVTALRAYSMVFQADMHRAVELCHEALEYLPESDLFLRSIMTWILSLARLDDHGMQDGKDALKELARKSQQAGNRLVAVTALCQQAKLQARQGRLHDAKKTYHRSLQVATDAAGRRLPIAGEALIGLGELEREWNHLDAAAEYLGEGIRLANQWSELAAFDAYIPLARIKLAQGDVEGARQAIETAREISVRSEATTIDDIVVELEQAFLRVIEGDTAGATTWAQRRGLVADPDLEPATAPDVARDLVSARLRKYEQLVLARLFLLQDRADRALHVLKALLALARRLARVDLLIEIQILRALALDREGERDQAMEALAEALSLAEPGGWTRTFLDEGERVRFLILDFGFWIEGRTGTMDAELKRRVLEYARRLLAAFPEPPAQGSAPPDIPIPSIQSPTSRAHYPTEPLTERELEVLRLLATGMSNPEIAEQLVVAVSTVRSHCKSIYGKLDVHSRWDAVQRGHKLGLI